MFDEKVIIYRFLASRKLSSSEEAKKILSEISSEDCRELPPFCAETIRNCLRFINEKDGYDAMIETVKDTMAEPEDRLADRLAALLGV